MIGAIKTIYSYYARDTEVELLVNTWTKLLQSYPDEIVDVAFFKCLQSCKVPPTPADVIERINALSALNEPTDEELWVTYEKALRETNYQMQRFNETHIDSTGVSNGERARNKVEEIWQGLPEKIKGYLGSKGELMRNARDWNMSADYCTYEKPRFMKSMPIMAKRQEFSGLLLEHGGERFLLGGRS